jgi:hypothetical protein
MQRSVGGAGRPDALRSQTTPTSQSLHRRHSSRLGTTQPWVSKSLDLDASFFWLLLVFLVLLVLFLNLRSSHVELSPSQVAEYERRTQVLSNSTVYIVEVHRPEGLLTKLSLDNWIRVSANIDLVAFVYDDLPVFLRDDWIARAEQQLLDPALPHAQRFRAGVGIMLFPCGCILPNSYFQAIGPRLRGMECNLLPGWVLSHEDVHWMSGVDATDSGMKPCKRQKRISGSQVVADFAVELATIQQSVQKLRNNLATAPAAMAGSGNNNTHLSQAARAVR